MHDASLQTVSMNRVRVTIVLLASMGVFVGTVLMILQFPYLPGEVMLGGLVAGFAGYVTIFMVGVRRWAATHVRYELDEAGLREIGPSGELRDRVRWSDMREFVFDAVRVKGSNIRYLQIDRRHGKPLRVSELQTRAGREEFGVFCGHFLAAVARYRAAEPTAAVREGESVYDRAFAQAIGRSSPDRSWWAELTGSASGEKKPDRA
jgi:hypothetical protein